MGYEYQLGESFDHIVTAKVLSINDIKLIPFTNFQSIVCGTIIDNDIVKFLSLIHIYNHSLLLLTFATILSVNYKFSNYPLQYSFANSFNKPTFSIKFIVKIANLTINLSSLISRLKTESMDFIPFILIQSLISLY